MAMKILSVNVTLDAGQALKPLADRSGRGRFVGAVTALEAEGALSSVGTMTDAVVEIAVTAFT
jgi:hypothetical protein